MKEIYISKIGTISLLIIASLTIMVGTVVAPGLLTISSKLGVQDYAPWLITIPSLGVVLSSFFLSKFIERFGYYNSLKIGLFFYGLFGVSGMFLYGTILLFIDRFLLGVTTGIVLVCVNGLISYFFKGEKRLKIIAMQAISIELGGVVILSVSGFLSVISWNYPFFIYLFAWVFLAMLFLFIPKPKNSIYQKEDDDEKLEVKSSLYKVFFAVLSSMFLFFIAIIVLPLYLPKYGFTEDKVGYFLSFVSFMAIIAAGFIPKLSKVLKEKTIIRVAFLSYSLAHSLFFLFNENITFIIAGVFLGIGFGFSIPLLNHITIEKSDTKTLSKNLSLYTMLIFLGQFLATFSEFFPGKLNTIFLIASLLSLALILISLIIKKKVYFDKIKICKIRNKN